VTQLLHNLIHLLSEVSKEEEIQEQSHIRKQKLLDKAGKILEDMVKEVLNDKTW